jgi:hypothetical protein
LILWALQPKLIYFLTLNFDESKRELKYLKDLTKEQLEEQMIELYEKFSPVKVYYNFVFNPNEDKILQEYKIKVSNEYFPIQTGKTKRRAKMRRSVAQKFIKHFILLGVDHIL